MKKIYSSPKLQCTEFFFGDVLSLSVNGSTENEPGITDVWEEKIWG